VSTRLNGLDTLRAAAIVMVLAFHYIAVSGKSTFGFIGDIGWTGVDLFFVLSGYLIGNQIFSQIVQERNFSLKTFYAKRLLRTLPNYYFILAMYLIFPFVLGEKVTAPLWQFLTFTQNFGLRLGQTFSHSWSLCIEEQFYLILPAIVIMIVKLKRARQFAWIAIGAAIVAGMVVRGMAWLLNGRSTINAYDYYEYIYYSSFSRFDELLPGVAIAMLRNFHSEKFSRLTKKGNILFLIGFLMVFIMLFLFSNYLSTDEYGCSFLIATFGYPLLATGFGIMTLSALSENSILHKIRVPGAARIALWSYAIYLAHKPIFKLLALPVTKMGIDKNSFLGVSIIMTVSVFGGWLLFKFIETPFMVLRARLYPAGNTNPKIVSMQIEPLPKQSRAT